MSAFPLSTKFHCPKCKRGICSTDGNVYTSVPDANGITYPYVYLRRHNASPGVRCSGFAARVVQAVKEAS